MNVGDRGLMAIGWGLTYCGIAALMVQDAAGIGETGGIVIALIFAVLGLGIVGKLVQLEVRSDV